MSKSDQLWQNLFQYGTHAPRDLVVAYVKTVVDEAKELPKQDLASNAELVASKLIISIAQQE
jgi:mono/diheme cytochrome c family protein